MEDESFVDPFPLFGWWVCVVIHVVGLCVYFDSDNFDLNHLYYILGCCQGQQRAIPSGERESVDIVLYTISIVPLDDQSKSFLASLSRNVCV